MISKTKNKDRCTPAWVMYQSKCLASVADKRVTQGFNRYMRSMGCLGYITP